MNGDDILLDTNAVIYFLEGRPRLAEIVLLAGTIAYSVITEIELLSATHLTDPDTSAIRGFLSQCRRVKLTAPVVERAIEIRRQTRLKTPDAIIAASAMVSDLTLITADTGFSKVTGLAIVTDLID